MPRPWPLLSNLSLWVPPYLLVSVSLLVSEDLEKGSAGRDGLPQRTRASLTSWRSSLGNYCTKKSSCSSKYLSTNLRASEISSMNLSQLEKFIQRFVLHICFHMMVVSTVLRVRPSIIRAWRDHPYIIFILKQRSG